MIVVAIAFGVIFLAVLGSRIHNQVHSKRVWDNFKKQNSMRNES